VDGIIKATRRDEKQTNRKQWQFETRYLSVRYDGGWLIGWFKGGGGVEKNGCGGRDRSV
jgi:hypothetical protein